MPKVPLIIPSITEMTELCDLGSKSSDLKKKQNDEDKVKFRCDFMSTQTKVMLARGWTQVNFCVKICRVLKAVRQLEHCFSLFVPRDSRSQRQQLALVVVRDGRRAATGVGRGSEEAASSPTGAALP